MYEVGKCRLKILLKERRITQNEFASMMGMSKQQINDYITGHTATMSLKTAKNIAHKLDCSIDDLYEWTRSKTK
ncbi:helix-turn-helix transcriptional regulator [Priestia megaterium]|uniref:helix-turn-helix transcriptional regulator n=1 Tax=Priestia megaterium TaxID=1404 RepID=UPI00366CE97F